MSTTDPRAAYAAFTEALIADFRAHGGHVSDGPFLGSDLLLLHTTGARSGEARIAPVVFSRDGEDLIIVASKGGAPVNPSWFANLVADANATVEAGGETFPVRAEIAPGTERDRLYAAHAVTYPTFLEYAAKTTREIPVVRLRRAG